MIENILDSTEPTLPLKNKVLILMSAMTARVKYISCNVKNRQAFFDCADLFQELCPVRRKRSADMLHHPRPSL